MKLNRPFVYILVIVCIIAVGGGIWYEYRQSEKITEEVRIQNEKWADQQKYPWRYRDLKSPSDIQICNMEISNSDLTEEEKHEEYSKLWNKYYNKQQ